MAKEEIIAGLENAVVRGESIEKAMQSMISAGYSPNEVKEASGYIDMGTIGRINEQPGQIPAQETQEIQSAYAQETQQPQAEAEAQTEEQAPEYQKLPSEPRPQVQEKPKSRKKMWIIILIILMVLIIAGIAGIIFFGDKILGALFPAA